MVVFNLDSNQLIATLALSGCSNVLFTSHPFTNRKAFHILVENLLPWSHNASSNNKSLPAAAHDNIPKRTPSAPYLSINSKASGEFPKDLLISLRCLSRTIPVK